MRVLCTNHALSGRGGTESYLQTAADALRDLGHSVEFYSPNPGPFATVLKESAYVVHGSVDSLRDDYDVIHGQHVDAVARVRGRLRDTPLVFATHSWFIPIEDPLAELGAGAFIAFNDLTLRRLQEHSVTQGRPVVRLRQPVAVSFGDGTRSPIADRPRVALASSRNFVTRERQLADACARLGIELSVVGKAGSESPDSRLQMMGADIVFGVGRTALEGMALGRAVYVIDESRVGGWVTASSYADLESDGFTGHHPGGSTKDLIEDLRSYATDLGSVARTMAVTHHRAPIHAVDLVEVYQSAGAVQMTEVDFESLGRLADENLRLTARVRALEWEVARLSTAGAHARRVLSSRLRRGWARVRSTRSMI